MELSAVTKARDKLQHMLHGISATGWKTRSLLTAVFGLVLIRFWRAGNFTKMLRPIQRQSRDTSEPGLIQKHSTYESFTTASGFNYPKIRCFYHPHPQATKLPKDLPLLVFMHGVGGNVTQFAPLLTSLTNVAPCLAIDLPGCGLSEFKPNNTAAYTTKAFAELLCTAIERFRDASCNQQVVLIGHSMGCSVSALLASSASPLRQQLKVDYIIGFVAICPRSGPFTEREALAVSRLQWVPSPLFDLLRFFDSRGGLRSGSVTRMVGMDVDDETKRLQQRYDEQSRSPVFLRTIAGMLQSATSQTVSFPGREIWSGIEVPPFLVAGEADNVTSPQEVEQIATWLTKPTSSAEAEVDSALAKPRSEEPATPVQEDVAPDQEPSNTASKTGGTADVVPTTAGDVQLAQYRLSKDGSGACNQISKGSTISAEMVKDEQKASRHSFALKTTVFPAPAAHGLMYTTSIVRILSGLIESFLAHHVDERLTLGWQLQHMTTSGKWDVKNLKKWQSVDPCSEPIGGIFRAMKTMREVDDEHNPREFVKKFSGQALPDGVAMIVDISHESPVYDPKGLEEGGVEYHKFPTVSKLPPTADEVEHFTSLIDQLRRSQKCQPKDGETVHPVIGVHCHYGFNRTGFFIVTYLVERLGYKLKDAIEEFAAKRPPGIKHEHFVNELYVRYAVKMERRGTVVG